MFHEYAPLVLYLVCVFKNGLLNETNLSVTKLFRERISKDLNTAREEGMNCKSPLATITLQNVPFPLHFRKKLP